MNLHVYKYTYIYRIPYVCNFQNILQYILMFHELSQKFSTRTHTTKINGFFIVYRKLYNFLHTYDINLLHIYTTTPVFNNFDYKGTL